MSYKINDLTIGSGIHQKVNEITLENGTNINNISIDGTKTGTSATDNEVLTAKATLSTIETGKINMSEKNEVSFKPAVDLGTISTDTTIDFTTCQIQKFTLGADINIDFSMNTGTKFLIIDQDSTGGRSITWPSAYWGGGGTIPDLSSDAGARDIVIIFYDGNNYHIQINNDWVFVS